jgi:UDP-GlcNAc:undecaprenyl-phosphate GlcNAc-1-phosphate transferase
MLAAVLLAALAYVLARLLVTPWRTLLRHHGLVRPNYLGRLVPVGLGLLPVILAGSIDILLGGTDALLLAVGLFGFALIGLADDVLGDRRTGGIRGHLISALHGQPTTGLMKAVGGLLLAVFLAMRLSHTLWAGVMGGLVAALSANALNLFDLRPGRALKVFLSWGGIVILAGGTTGLAPLWGAALAVLPVDLQGAAMLGDAGANPLGFAVGFASLSLPPIAIGCLLLALILLHLYAERASLTKLIERVPWLRYLDQLGRS